MQLGTTLVVPGQGGFGRSDPAGDVFDRPVVAVSSAHIFKLKKHDWAMIIYKQYSINIVRREVLVDAVESII